MGRGVALLRGGRWSNKSTYFIGLYLNLFSCCFARDKKKKEENALFFWSVNVFSTKVLIGDTIFTSPTGDGTAISTWSSEPREGPAVCSAKVVPSFLSYFKTLSIGPAPGIEPTTSRSAVKRSTD